jgi:hypothetical protein
VGRIYYITFDEVAVTAQQDLFDVAPATNKPIYVHELKLSQSTEVGDAAEEQLHIRMVRGFATVGSGGGSATVARQLASDAAASFTARINDTTKAVVGGGVTDIVDTDSWNVRSGLPLIWTPETRIWVTAADTRIVVQLNTTPGDSVTMSGKLTVEEF